MATKRKRRGGERKTRKEILESIPPYSEYAFVMDMKRCEGCPLAPYRNCASCFKNSEEKEK
jgi:hypothetical protein